MRVVFPLAGLPSTCSPVRPSACQQLAQQISMHYPRLDGVLHNAGLLGDICPMEEQKPEVWQQVMQVNVNGTFMLTRGASSFITPFGIGLAGLHLIQRRSSGPRQLGRLCRFQIRHRRDDAGAGRRVSKPPPAGKLYQPRRHSHRNARQRVPDGRSAETENPR